jgi:hypothetical protein
MRSRRPWWIGVLVVLAGLAWGCGEDPTCGDCCSGDCPHPPPGYLPQTSPENVLNNLHASYVRREIEEYAKLLAPDFRFYFQEADIPAGLPREYWNRDEDSTGTGALLSSSEVSSINLDLGTFAVEDAGRPDEPGAKRIRLTHVNLEVEQFNGTTLLVLGDIQDMYFRRGNVAAGTDSTKWYLVEWRDVGGGGNLKPASGTIERAPDLAKSSPLVQPSTWGKIKSKW